MKKAKAANWLTAVAVTIAGALLVWQLVMKDDWLALLFGPLSLVFWTVILTWIVCVACVLWWQRRWWLLITTPIALYPAVTGVLLLAGEVLTPPTPPLLKDASAEGGWWSGGCPAHPAEAFTKDWHEARSSDVETRLARQFPPGTPEQVLIVALRRQGFELTAPCDNDPQIHHADFRQRGGSILGPFPVYANIAWKTDDLGHIVWTKAFISYTGL